MNIGYIEQENRPLNTIDKVKYLFGMAVFYNTRQGYVFKIPTNKKEKRMRIIIRNLQKQIEKRRIDTIVFSNNIINSKFYLDMEQEFLKEGKKILNGRKLMLEMNYEIFEYILNLQNTTMNRQDIFFLIKKDNSLDLQFLSRFIENCKTVNIVTNDIDRFKKIQERLYEKENILISVSNNKSKSLKKAKYIFNINMEQNDIEKFKKNRDAIIVNFKDNIKCENKSFDGINVNYIQIYFPDEYKEQFEQIDKLDEFDKARLYESILVRKIEEEKNRNLMLSKSQLQKRKTMAIDIITKDGIKIIGLIGNNGKIEEKEIMENGKKNIDKTKKVV